MSLQKLLKESILFLEGQAEDLVKKFPELQPAYDAGLKNPQYLRWIQKRRGGEPVEDVIGLIDAFDKNRDRLKSKGKSSDIYFYKNAQELRIALEELGTSKGQEKRRLKDEETTMLGQFGDWIVAMPHTVESSCQLGKGTTWCTAATKSQNLFLSYVAGGAGDVILYYLIKKGADPRKEPESKLSVGFTDGEPYLEGDDGNVTVDAANDGIDESRLRKILSSQYEPIMSAMTEHAQSIQGKHPARMQVKKIASSKDVSLFRKYTANYKDRELYDFVKNIIENYDYSDEVGLEILKLTGKEPVIGGYGSGLASYSTLLARNKKSSEDLLRYIYKQYPQDYDTQYELMANSSIPRDLIISVLEDKYARNNLLERLYINSAIFKKTPDLMKTILAKTERKSGLLESLLLNKGASSEFLDDFARSYLADKSYKKDMYPNIIRNNNASKETLQYIYDYFVNLKKNRRTPEARQLPREEKYDSYSHRLAMQLFPRNISTGKEVLLNVLKNEYLENEDSDPERNLKIGRVPPLALQLARHPNSDPDVLSVLLNKDYFAQNPMLYNTVVSNKNVNSELIRKAYQEANAAPIYGSDEFIEFVNNMAGNDLEKYEFLSNPPGFKMDSRVDLDFNLSTAPATPPDVLRKIIKKYSNPSAAYMKYVPREAAFTPNDRNRDEIIRKATKKHFEKILNNAKQNLNNQTSIDENKKIIRKNVMTDEILKQIVIEELKLAILEEKKKKSEKDRMKCNSPRRIRKGEAGHGKKKFVVKACDGGTEKIIRYGDANMEIKKDSPARRKSFRARHNCKNPGSKLKARYWSCKKW